MLPQMQRHKIRWLISITVLSEIPDTPSGLDDTAHLRLPCHDIYRPTKGAIAPSRHHIRQLCEFARKWQTQSDLLIHCSAGVSRSSAAALTVAACLHPGKIEEVTRRLRQALPHAEPNYRLIEIADRFLNLDGRLMNAVRQIGKGTLVDPAPPGCFSLGD